MTRSINDDDRLRRYKDHDCLNRAACACIHFKLADVILLEDAVLPRLSDSLLGCQTVIEEGLKAGC